jgi:hypothetical protein
VAKVSVLKNTAAKADAVFIVLLFSFLWVERARHPGVRYEKRILSFAHFASSQTPLRPMPY